MNQQNIITVNMSDIDDRFFKKIVAENPLSNPTYESSQLSSHPTTQFYPKKKTPELIKCNNFRDKFQLNKLYERRVYGRNFKKTTPEDLLSNLTEA